MLNDPILTACQKGSVDWQDAFNKHDAAACAEHYAPTCVMNALPFGVYEGREAIKEFWQYIMDQGFKTVSYSEPEWKEHEQGGYVLTAKWTMNKVFGIVHAEHSHPGGEEILVLEGIFSDETGYYGPGTYLRNPPGTSHSPHSAEGCVLFVKLHQFTDGDNTTVRINTKNGYWQRGIGDLSIMPLHRFGKEQTALVRWPENEVFKPHLHEGGEEILVVSGTFHDEHGAYPTLSWLRNPHLSEHHPYVNEETVILVKTGHLPVPTTAA